MVTIYIAGTILNCKVEKYFDITMLFLAAEWRGGSSGLHILRRILVYIRYLNRMVLITVLHATEGNSIYWNLEAYSLSSTRLAEFSYYFH